MNKDERIKEAETQLQLAKLKTQTKRVSGFWYRWQVAMQTTLDSWGGRTFILVAFSLLLCSLLTWRFFENPGTSYLFLGVPWLGSVCLSALWIWRGVEFQKINLGNGREIDLVTEAEKQAGKAAAPPKIPKPEGLKIKQQPGRRHIYDDTSHGRRLEDVTSLDSLTDDISEASLKRTDG